MEKQESAALLAEKNGYRKLLKKLSLTQRQAFAKPAGHGKDFPDFGFRLTIGEKKIDIFVEYKKDCKAYMGSMMDWTYDGKSYSTPNITPEKEQLIYVMNSVKEAKENGDRLLSDFKQYADKKISKLYSGVMTVENDKIERKRKLLAFERNTRDLQIANIEDASLGDIIKRHYIKKFLSKIRKDADYSILLMMIGSSIWFIDESGNLTDDEKQQLVEKFGASKIPILQNLSAKLEVRISLKNLKDKHKPVRIDVFSSLRLASNPDKQGLIIRDYT